MNVFQQSNILEQVQIFKVISEEEKENHQLIFLKISQFQRFKTNNKFKTKSKQNKSFRYFLSAYFHSVNLFVMTRIMIFQ